MNKRVILHEIAGLTLAVALVLIPMEAHKAVAGAQTVIGRVLGVSPTLGEAGGYLQVQVEHSGSLYIGCSYRVSGRVIDRPGQRLEGSGRKSLRLCEVQWQQVGVPLPMAGRPPVLIEATVATWREFRGGRFEGELVRWGWQGVGQLVAKKEIPDAAERQRQLQQQQDLARKQKEMAEAAERRKRVEIERQRQLQHQQELARKQQELALAKAKAEAQAKQKAEAETKRRAELEAKKRAEEARKAAEAKAEAEPAARRKAEVEARARADAEAKAKEMAEAVERHKRVEIERQRQLQHQQEVARKQQELALAKAMAEAAAKQEAEPAQRQRQAEIERQRQLQQQQELARKQKEMAEVAERQRQTAERQKQLQQQQEIAARTQQQELAAAKAKAETEAKQKAEAETKRRVELEAKKRAEEARKAAEAKAEAEAAAKRKAEVEARAKADAEAKAKEMAEAAEKQRQAAERQRVGQLVARPGLSSPGPMITAPKLTYRLVFPYQAPTSRLEALVLERFGVVKYMNWVRFKSGFKWSLHMSMFTAKILEGHPLAFVSLKLAINSLQKMFKLAPYIPMEDINVYLQSQPISQTQQFDEQGKPIIPTVVYYQADALYRLVPISDPDMDPATGNQISNFLKGETFSSLAGGPVGVGVKPAVPTVRFTTLPPSRVLLATLTRFDWQGGSPGLEYRYKLDVPGDWIGGIRYILNKWTDWGTTESITYSDFILAGNYTFSVQARDPRTGHESKVIPYRFSVYFQMPELFEEAVQINWQKARRAPTKKQQYEILAQEFHSAHLAWMQKFEYQRGLLKNTIDPRWLMDQLVPVPTEEATAALLKWADEGVALTVKRLLAPFKLYKLLQVAGVDLILLFRNIEANKAASMALLTYHGWEGFERLARQTPTVVEPLIPSRSLWAGTIRGVQEAQSFSENAAVELSREGNVLSGRWQSSVGESGSLRGILAGNHFNMTITIATPSCREPGNAQGIGQISPDGRMLSARWSGKTCEGSTTAQGAFRQQGR